MKKFLLSLFIVSSCFLFNAQAQIKKGAVLLGGDLGANKLKMSILDSALRDEAGLNLNVSYGKAIRDNLIFGGSVTWRNGHVNDHSVTYRFNSNTWGLGVFLRKYQQLGASGFYVFAQGNFNGDYTAAKSKQSLANEAKTKGWSVTLAAYPGISFELTKKLQIETGLSDVLRLRYDRSRTKNSNPVVTDWASSSISFSSSLDNFSGLYVGFRVLLN